jgi:S1-C subfamily serine protease
MKFLKLIAVFLVFSFCASVASSQEGQPAQSLPSLADLQKLHFESATSPKLAGVPTDAELEMAIDSFNLFHDGAEDVTDWKWNQSHSTRGPVDTQVYKRAVNAVVYIMAATEPPQPGKKTGVAEGAGAILDPDGLVLTNWHVTKKASQGRYPIIVFVKPFAGVEPIDSLAYSAHVEFYNDRSDLSLLRLDKYPPYQLSKLKIAPMSSVVVGENVHVIGHPRGQAWSYSNGVVSQIRSKYKAVLHGEDGKDPQSFEADVLQMQTATSPGNSGGPVLDDNGNIIGLVSFGIGDAENVNFAIAADEIAVFLQHHAAQAVQPKLRGITQAEYSVAQVPGGDRVIKAERQGHTEYLIVDSDSKLKSISIDAGNGALIQAWQPGPSGGFDQWRAKFADGKTAEATGDGEPTSFVIKKQ